MLDNTTDTMIDKLDREIAYEDMEPRYTRFIHKEDTSNIAVIYIEAPEDIAMLVMAMQASNSTGRTISTDDIIASYYIYEGCCKNDIQTQDSIISAKQIRGLYNAS